METCPILARTDQWVVVAKPPRLLVHRTPWAKQDRIFALQLVRDQVGQHVYPVSRLDRPASGCLVFGLSSEGARSLQAAMADPSAVKTYLAHVRGEWKRGAEPVLVDKPMKDDKGRVREAETLVECLGATDEPRSSLLRAFPKTGRFHQVRRHVRDLHHPIIGDAAHGDTKNSRYWREEHNLLRLGLHCARLDLPLPEGGRFTVECPVYEDLVSVWRTLPWWDEARALEPLLNEIPLPLPDLDAMSQDTPPEEVST